MAKRAGVAKGTLYLYFATKEDLFRAVARSAFTSHLEGMDKAASELSGSARFIIPLILNTAAEGASNSHVPAIARMVISESKKFPDLARIWHDNVVARVLSLLTVVLTEGQKRGEVRHGNALHQALSVIGPMVTATLFHEIFPEDSTLRPDLDSLAKSHADIVLRGLFESPCGLDSAM